MSCFEMKVCLRAIYRIVKQRIISVHRRVSTGFRILPVGDADALKNEARVKVSMHRIVTDKCFLNFEMSCRDCFPNFANLRI